MRLRSGTQSPRRGPTTPAPNADVRRRGGLGVLAVGWAVALVSLADQTPAADPRYVSPPIAFETEFQKHRRSGEFPAAGVVGYRDEISPNTRDAHSARTQRLLVYQFLTAPVRLDPDGNHDLTLVVTRARSYLERAGGKP